MASEPSTLIAWSWTGYTHGQPNGPLPHRHGYLTLIAQCFGLLLPILVTSAGSPGPTIFAHPLWLAVGSVATFVVYSYRNWLGYSGGLVLAFFLMSITPMIFQDAASTGKVARTYFTAWLVSCILNLVSIFTVAYAFVPGGVYLRERTDLWVSLLLLVQ